MGGGQEYQDYFDINPSIVNYHNISLFIHVQRLMEF